MAKKSAAPKKAAPKKAAPKKAAAKKTVVKETVIIEGNDLEPVTITEKKTKKNPHVENIIKMTNPFTQLTDSKIKEAKKNVEKYKGNHKTNLR